ncbi:MAG: pyridoxal phosphate-dependent aminotransferase [Candidatus Sericytochromatia bacterium]
MKITNFNLEKWYVEYEFSSKYNFSASGIKQNTLNDLNIDINKNLILTYSQAYGNQELREKIAKNYNISSEEVLITNGAIEALFLIQIILSDTNKKIITINPTYPALYQIFKDTNCDVYNWNLNFEEKFRPNFEELEKLILLTKAEILIINFPNNPTGINLTKNELEKLLKIAEKYNLFIISDEVYSDLALEKNTIYKYYKNSVSINSFSKAYGLAGIRIGYMLSNKEIIEKCTNLRHYTTLCNNLLGESIALDVLNNKKAIFKNNFDLINKNKSIILEQLNTLKEKGIIDYVEPDCGVMLFCKLNNSESEAFCREFEKNESILLLPANKYHNDFKHFIRIGFGIETDKLLYCLERFISFLHK